jgi:predicted Zn-dependent protease
MKTIDPARNNLSAISRRDFLWLTSLAAGGLLLGCAANPVTGKSQLMLMSEEQEVNIDKQQSPHQISSDYGTMQDQDLVAYIDRTGQNIASLTHRPQMPYNFHPVNAVYINAYAFPGGTIAATRGILLKLQNEAELAALLGHELGHVNARHTAELMSKNQITSTVVGGLAAILGAQNARYADIASSIGMLGAGALLASYSRDNERQADELGMAYMVRAGYGTNGMVGLMTMLNSMSEHKLNATQLLFATHPMSSERYATALKTAAEKYPSARDLPLHRERYMDHTAGLRAIEPAIVALQEGDGAMAQEKYDEAASSFKKALKQAPGDYAGLVMMSMCQIGQKKYTEARRYAEDAQKAYPQEARAYHLSGFAKIKTQEYESALADFNTYEKRLPGNPNITFFKGLSYEGMQQQKPAADNYYKYLQVVNQGSQAQYAYRRLVEWGYLKKQ